MTPPTACRSSPSGSASRVPARRCRRSGAEQHPNRVRVDDDGHAAPEWYLAAHLFGDDEPIHLEVSNTGFENEISWRVEAARAREGHGRLLDPRAAYP